MIDLLIRNGRIVDGTGSPWATGDVAISGDTIVDVGRLGDVPAAQVIDAHRRVVCPGFIDMHAHSDVMLLANPRHEAKVRQGVTTEVIGQDGTSYAPLSPANMDFVRRYFAAANGTPDVGWDWQTVAEYLDRFDRRVAINVAYLLPHGALRLEVVGLAPRLATPEELSQMQRLALEGLEQGAFGLSTGLTYIPCCYSNTAEMIELCRPVAARGGYYAVHWRGHGDGCFDPMRETLQIAAETGVAGHLSHFKTPGVNHRGKAPAMLAEIDAARSRGLDITIENYPYTVGSTVLHALFPTRFQQGQPGEIMAALASPAVRDDLRAELARGWLFRWDEITISAVGPAHRGIEGRTITELAADAGQDEVTYACELIVTENLEVGCLVVDTNEDDMRQMMQHAAHMYGSDSVEIGANPHPRGHGTYPRVLGKYVRELKLLTLEQAIRKMTSFPAQRLGLADRGVLKRGLKADLVVFDPDTVSERATFRHSRQYPEGIDYVLVNGQIVINQGEHSGALPGRALRRGS